MEDTSVTSDVRLIGGRFTTGQVAKMIGSSRTFVVRIPEDQLPCVRIGRNRRYDPADVAAYLARMRSGG